MRKHYLAIALVWLTIFLLNLIVQNWALYPVCAIAYVGVIGYLAMVTSPGTDIGKLMLRAWPMSVTMVLLMYSFWAHSGFLGQVVLWLGIASSSALSVRKYYQIKA